MKNFLACLAISGFGAALFYELFGPVLIGIFFLFAALYFFYGSEPNKILGVICGVISLTCYSGFFYLGWGR